MPGAGGLAPSQWTRGAGPGAIPSVPAFATVGINHQRLARDTGYRCQESRQQARGRAIDAPGHNLSAAIRQGQAVRQAFTMTDVLLVPATEADPGGHI